MKTVPFFVVDRPISLEIIKGLKIPAGQKIGLMAHANTSDNFRKAFHDYPRKQTVKMCDSAIFHENRFENNYDTLFTRYQQMGADFGIIIDVLGSARATIRSAELALKAYDEKKHKFELVGVAQGTTVEEYLKCYRELRARGFDHIAVGGLLKKRERSARYMNVSDKFLMEDLLREIRKEFNPEWLFVLGCLHPSRLDLFKELEVWGDYKGWIFEYEKRDESLAEGLNKLCLNHLAHAPARFISSPRCVALQQISEQRQRNLVVRDNARKKMFKAKRQLQDFVNEVYDIVVGRKVKSPQVVQGLTSRGLLSESDQKAIISVLKEATLPEDFIKRLKALAEQSRRRTDSLKRAEKKTVKSNTELLAALERLIRSKSTPSEINRLGRKLTVILRRSEQQHRIKQVRLYIETEILGQL
jgi:hypothetical protein